MLDRLNSLNRASWYWPALMVIGVASIGIALFYQYSLDYRPCVVCIHVRLWIICFVLLAGFAMLVRQSWMLTFIAHLLTSAVMAVLLERSYLLLGTERGWVFGACDFDLGLPGWLTFEEWFPSLFKVWEPCGYTPELLFGITMAEALVVIYAGLVVISLLMTAACFLGKNNR